MIAVADLVGVRPVTAENGVGAADNCLLETVVAVNCFELTFAPVGDQKMMNPT